MLTREIIEKCAATWDPAAPPAPSPSAAAVGEAGATSALGLSTGAVVDICRYLSAFTWALRDKLRDGEMRDDILQLLLPPADAAWVATQRSRPLAIHGRLRRLIYEQTVAGALSTNMQFVIEGDLKVRFENKCTKPSRTPRSHDLPDGPGPIHSRHRLPLSSVQLSPRNETKRIVKCPFARAPARHVALGGGTRDPHRRSRPQELDRATAACERLFSSPIPPTMSRHGMRSLTLWLLALPVRRPSPRSSFLSSSSPSSSSSGYIRACVAPLC